MALDTDLIEALQELNINVDGSDMFTGDLTEAITGTLIEKGKPLGYIGNLMHASGLKYCRIAKTLNDLGQDLENISIALYCADASNATVAVCLRDNTTASYDEIAGILDLYGADVNQKAIALKKSKADYREIAHALDYVETGVKSALTGLKAVGADLNEIVLAVDGIYCRDAVAKVLRKQGAKFEAIARAYIEDIGLESAEVYGILDVIGCKRPNAVLNKIAR